jgi:hypothetical protein
MFERSLARDQDVGQPLGFIATAAQMRNADRAKQVECVQIPAQIPTPLGALHQPIDRVMNGRACIFIEPGRASGNAAACEFALYKQTAGEAGEFGLPVRPH